MHESPKGVLQKSFAAHFWLVSEAGKRPRSACWIQFQDWCPFCRTSLEDKRPKEGKNEINEGGESGRGEFGLGRRGGRGYRKKFKLYNAFAVRA